MKKTITNLARGPRLFNVGEKGKATANQITIMPGETAEINLQDHEHPVVKAMLAAGEIAFGKDGEKSAQDEERVEPKGANLDAMSEDELKAYLKEYGASVQGNPNRETLMKRAREVAAARA
ncbi:hypothetical protein ABC766_00315 [Methylobacterium fujisawaense]|jgi:hypothetical protein|uniref:hypothetical protein n=1 Tax=Methylobacterium fujisawaense TaxID=107400 RepID=UPI0031F4A782